MKELRIKNEELRILERCARGFTLIELIISIAVFTIFLTVVSTAYINIVRSQRQANEVRKMYSEVRSFAETLAEDMRLGTIDYDCYKSDLPTPDLFRNNCPFSTIIDPQSSVANASPYLAIVNKDHTLKTVFWFDKANGQLKVKKYQHNGAQDNIDAAQWPEAKGYSSQDTGADDSGSQSLLSKALNVSNLTFSVNPPVNPYSADHYQKNQFQFQPKVTLTLSVENAQKNQAPFHLDFQTTLSSRVYTRFNSNGS